MRIISKRKLREFWNSKPSAKKPLEAWYKRVSAANWGQLSGFGE